MFIQNQAQPFPRKSRSKKAMFFSGMLIRKYVKAHKIFEYVKATKLWWVARSTWRHLFIVDFLNKKTVVPGSIVGISTTLGSTIFTRRLALYKSKAQKKKSAKAAKAKLKAKNARKSRGRPRKKKQILMSELFTLRKKKVMSQKEKRLRRHIMG